MGVGAGAGAGATNAGAITTPIRPDVVAARALQRRGSAPGGRAVDPERQDAEDRARQHHGALAMDGTSVRQQPT